VAGAAASDEPGATTMKRDTRILLWDEKIWCGRKAFSPILNPLAVIL